MTHLVCTCTSMHTPRVSVMFVCSPLCVQIMLYQPMLCSHCCSSIQTDQLKELIYYALSELAGETSGSFRGASENIVNFETYLAEVSIIKKTTGL